MLDCMEELGLEPNASLHHFTHPQARPAPRCATPSAAPRSAERLAVPARRSCALRRTRPAAFFFQHAMSRRGARLTHSPPAPCPLRAIYPGADLLPVPPLSRAAHPGCTLAPPPSSQWFEVLGGFEREENIPIFVQWCVKAVELFGRRIHFWATFNEPTVGRRGRRGGVGQGGRAGRRQATPAVIPQGRKLGVPPAASLAAPNPPRPALLPLAPIAPHLSPAASAA